MRPFNDVFSIFQKEGLVKSIKNDKKLTAFIWTGLAWTLFFGAIYGLSMGIVVDKKTVYKDVLKVPLIYMLGLGISFPAFYITSRLVGIKESAQKLGAAFLSFFIISSTILAIAAPIIFFYGLASQATEQLFLVHIVLNNIAILLGVIVMASTMYHSIEIEKSRLVLPIAIGVIFVILAALALIIFFQPFFYTSNSFSTGWDRLLELFLNIK